MQTRLLGAFSFSFQAQPFIQLLSGPPGTYFLLLHSQALLMCFMFSHCNFLHMSPLTLSSTLELHLMIQNILYQKYLGTCLFSLPGCYSPKLQKLSNLSFHTLLKTYNLSKAAISLLQWSVILTRVTDTRSYLGFDNTKQLAWLHILNPGSRGERQ